MKMNRNIYPYNPQPELLPIYLAGIGGSEYQGYVNRPEGYQWHQILYSAHGNGFLEYDGQKFDIHAGDYFYIPADYPSVYYGKQTKWDVRWLVFTGFGCEKLLSNFDMQRPIILRSPENSTLEKLFEKMVTSQLNERMISNFVCSGLLYEYLLEFHLKRNENVLNSKNRKYNLLLPALVYIENHLDRDISIEELSAVTGITHQHLCRIFKETQQMRPVEYLMRRRIEKAKEMLRNKAMPIATISSSLGFSSPAYFSTIFKQYEGIPPMNYRKTMC